MTCPSLYGFISGTRMGTPTIAPQVIEPTIAEVS